MAKSDITAAIGLGSAAASMIPGIGPIVGLAGGFGSQLFSWILGNDKFDWEGWKKKQLAGIDTHYDASLKNATAQANKSFDATIGQATNTQSMAGSVAGMSGAGTGRLQAQTYVNVAENRDRSVSSITNALEQNRAAMKSSVERQAAEGSMNEDFNAPNTLTYLQNLLGSMQSPVMQEGIAALISGPIAGISSLFKGKNNTTTTTAPVTNTAGTTYNGGIKSFDPNIESSTSYIPQLTNDNNNMFTSNLMFGPNGVTNWMPKFPKLKNYGR